MARMGEIIDGKYEVLREVGRGGMSVVYLAMDKRLNKQWAIKEFRKDKDDASKQVALKALLDEANLMKKLDHPTLPRIVDIIDDKQNVYVIMDYIEGESLNKVLDAYGAQPQEAVIEWAKQLADVLDYLHTQTPPVIYRDMKPANIMLKPDGTVRLIDFGIAREYKEGKAGDTEAIGTRGYAAPEQFGGKGQTDARTDIYSLGVTLYHLLTGKNPAEPPYEIYPIRHWNPSFSSGLEWLIQKCTQLNPGDRYQSCAEVTYVLENLDKFDVAYKKKQKSRMNLFVTSVVLTAAFAIASIGSFVGGNSLKAGTLESQIANEQYIEALKNDSENVELYVMLADQIHEKTDSVINADARGESVTDPEGEITLGDLKQWFPYQTLIEMKKDHPQEYAYIYFRLGYLLWEKYESDSVVETMTGDVAATAAAADRDRISQAYNYFSKIFNLIETSGIAKYEDSGLTYDEYSRQLMDYTGLSEKQFNMAKALYITAYLQENLDKFEANVAGEVMEYDGALNFAGVTDEEFANSPYAALFNANYELVKLMSGDGMTDTFKVITLTRLTYTLEAESSSFTSAVSQEDMTAYTTAMIQALNSLPDDFSDTKTVIENRLNTHINPALASNYSKRQPTQEENA